MADTNVAELFLQPNCGISWSATAAHFCRYSVDTATCQLLTDRPVTDFVVH